MKEMRISPRSVLFAFVSVIAVALAPVGCQDRNFNRSQVKGLGGGGPDLSKMRTACLSIQGNGQLFAAHLGEITALLERNILPVVVGGGSSASLTASVVRALLLNPSISSATVNGEDGKPLSPAQKAALVLAATSGPAETVLFLPILQHVGKLVGSVLGYLGVQSATDAFLGYPGQGQAHAEAITGQGVLLIDFLRDADFSDLLKERSFANRNQRMMSLWISHGDLLRVEPEDFVKALLIPQSDPRWSKDDGKASVYADIRQRFIRIFRDEDTGSDEDAASNVKKWNETLERFTPLLGKIDERSMVKAYMQVIKNVHGVPFIGSLAISFARPFFLPSPDRVWNAYLGKTRSGQPLYVPEGALLHTTARALERNLVGQIVDKTGIDSFYQVYYPGHRIGASGPNLHSELVDAWNGLGDQEGFLQFKDPASGKMKVLLPKRQYLIYDAEKGQAGIPLAPAIRSSITEPNAMVRKKLEVPSTTYERFDPENKAKWRHGIVTYGGWMEAVQLATIDRLPVCRAAELYAEASVRVQGLQTFQRQAARPIIDGPLRAALNAALNRESKTEEFVKNLNGVLDEAQAIRAKDGRKLVLDFNWDGPSALQDETKRAAMDGAFRDNRTAFFVRSYQHAARSLALQEAGIKMMSGMTEGDLAEAVEPVEKMGLVYKHLGVPDLSTIEDGCKLDAQVNTLVWNISDAERGTCGN